MKQPMKWLVLASCLVSSIMLTGCVSKILESKVTEPSLFVLRIGNVATANVAYPVQISVALPTASPALNTDRIAVFTGHRLDYFQGARWSGTAPQLTQGFLVSYLTAQQGFKSVTSDGMPANADYLLTLELRHFEAEYLAGSTLPQVQVNFTGTLFDIKTRRSVALLNASATATAREDRLDAVISAFENVTREAAASLTSQIGNAMAQAPEKN